jgi:hypothetical protein
MHIESLRTDLEAIGYYNAGNKVVGRYDFEKMWTTPRVIDTYRVCILWAEKQLLDYQNDEKIAE